jgi:hypothetical protein
MDLPTFKPSADPARDLRRAHDLIRPVEMRLASGQDLPDVDSQEWWDIETAAAVLGQVKEDLDAALSKISREAEMEGIVDPSERQKPPGEPEDMVRLIEDAILGLGVQGQMQRGEVGPTSARLKAYIQDRYFEIIVERDPDADSDDVG